MTNTTRFKDFGSGPEIKAEPLSFSIHGEKFECVPEVQGKLLLDLVKNSNEDDASASAAMITTFFDMVLTEKALPKFNELLASKTKIVSVETLAEIVGWLVGEYTNRPEEQPAVS